MPVNGNHLTVDAILDGLVKREGADKITNDPNDHGKRTRFGISEVTHPDLWNPGPPTLEQARARLTLVYVKPFDLLEEMGAPDVVRICCIDDAVMSSVVTAVKNLQRACDVSVDGLLGPITASAATHIQPMQLVGRLVHQRVRNYAQICKGDPTQLTWIVGWIDRAFMFLA